MGSDDRHIRFLLVEDDEDHAFVVMKTLKRERVMNIVDHAINGKVAMEMLRRTGEYAEQPLPDVILLDLKMPVMDGHEVLEALQSDDELSKIPVVVMTTSDAESDRVRAYDLKANSYVVKPVDFDRFRSLVSDLGFYWGVWNRPATDQRNER